MKNLHDDYNNNINNHNYEFWSNDYGFEDGGGPEIEHAIVQEYIVI